MVEKDQQTLFNDICARLPYGLKCQYKAPSEGAFADKPEYYDIIGIPDANRVDIIACDKYRFASVPLEEIKPYLRPMSSMTEEEFLEYHNIKYNKVTCRNNYERIDVGKFHNVGIVPIEDYLDWLNAHHFDYRGLIPMGLALEAKEGMY